MNPKQKIISDRRVQKALAVAVTARAAFYATKTQLEPLMNPGPFAKAYGAEIHATADVERGTDRLARFFDNEKRELRRPAGGRARKCERAT